MAEVAKVQGHFNLVNAGLEGKEVGKGKDFAILLKDTINEVNQLQKDSEKALADIATGQVQDLHQAAIAINKAETSLKLMLEIRNKAVSAYKEISRTQI